MCIRDSCIRKQKFILYLYMVTQMLFYWKAMGIMVWWISIFNFWLIFSIINLTTALLFLKFYSVIILSLIHILCKNFKVTLYKKKLCGRIFLISLKAVSYTHLGQQQRVAIARAIAAKPPVILADEPTGNLDSASSKEILNILKNLHKDGRTVILITHDDGIAARAKRVVRIMDGKIESDRINSEYEKVEEVNEDKDSEE